MKVINELITPLKANGEIDIEVFRQMIRQSGNKKNDFQLIFSPLGDGSLLSSEEKQALLHGIDRADLSHIICYFQLENEEADNRMIRLLASAEIEYIMICPPLGYSYNQNGLFLYVKNILKKLKEKKIILTNAPSSGAISFHFQTLKKLIRTYPNLIGLYENSNDLSLISLLEQNFPEFFLFVNEELFEHALKNHLTGIVSVNALVFGDDYQTVIEDYSHHFTNRFLIDYLKFVHEILSFSNNSTLFKAYMKRLGYPSMEVRLPLIIEKADMENLDLLLS